MKVKIEKLETHFLFIAGSLDPMRIMAVAN